VGLPLSTSEPMLVAEMDEPLVAAGGTPVVDVVVTVALVSAGGALV
jgi:hypothetical protein